MTQYGKDISVYVCASIPLVYLLTVLIVHSLLQAIVSLLTESCLMIQALLEFLLLFSHSQDQHTT